MVYFVHTTFDLAIIKNEKVLKKPPVSSKSFCSTVLSIKRDASVSPFLLKYYKATDTNKPTVIPQFRVKEYIVTAEN